ncbi:MAG: hypothetical protein R2822_30615 [Spirosomataceae bacterium]
MAEKQLTNDLSYNHDLDNNDNFSPDDQWLVYDTRTEIGGIAASAKIEKVNVATGEKKYSIRYPITKYGGLAQGLSATLPSSLLLFLYTA